MAPGGSLEDLPVSRDRVLFHGSLAADARSPPDAALDDPGLRHRRGHALRTGVEASYGAGLRVSTLGLQLGLLGIPVPRRAVLPFSN
jgi:hypothetical protein